MASGSQARAAVALLAASIGTACGGSGSMGPMGSGPGASPGAGAAFVAVVPAGGATGVPTDAPLTFRFSHAMAEGMEQYVDLHERDLSGPAVPIACAWTEGRTVLTCTPSAPLAPRTTYAVHLGGGMTSAMGVPIDYTTHGPGMGGQWIVTGGMMTGTHAGMGWGMMGPGWRHGNGSYGMVFTFTTA